MTTVIIRVIILRDNNVINNMCDSVGQGWNHGLYSLYLDRLPLM